MQNRVILLNLESEGNEAKVLTVKKKKSGYKLKASTILHKDNQIMFHPGFLMEMSQRISL